MDKFFTVIVVPEKGGKTYSYKVPNLLFKSATLFAVIFVILLGVLAYDYKQILDQMYKNQHLSIENRKLREQLNIFQIKINSIHNDISRIKIFEKKLRVITGVDDKGHIFSQDLAEDFEESPPELEKSTTMLNDPEFKKLKELYIEKISKDYGVSKHFEVTREWNDLIKNSLELSSEFATFDFRFNSLKKIVKDLEVDIHEIDQFLLDKKSFIKSTPTLMPTRGWITSYFGPRKSPYSGRLKMHEGVDIGARMGSNILATADGIVTYSGYKPGFGKFIQIDHGYGIETIFGHAQKLVVPKGKRVLRGDVVARVGNTGLSTGPHVHYEVRVNGVAVDPLYYILE